MKLSQKLASFFWVSFAAMIVVETLFFQAWMDSSAYIFSTGLFLSVVALGWVLADSNENNLEVPKALKVCVVAIALLAVVYYRFRYFGAKAGFIFLGIMVLNVAGVILLVSVLEFFPIGD